MVELFSLDIPVRITPRIEDEIDRIVDEDIVDIVPYKTGRLQDSIDWSISDETLYVELDNNLCDYWQYVDEKTSWISDLKDEIETNIQALTPKSGTTTDIRWDFSSILNTILKGFRR